MTKPTIPEVIDDFRAYKAIHLAWGSLHIVLDDNNVTEPDVQFCVDLAIETGDVEGERLARLLLQMSTTQRRKLGRVL